ncbi:MAG: RHS repeat-associated core domain-containing protein, partial [Thermoanaerobaculia bacterium]
ATSTGQDDEVMKFTGHERDLQSTTINTVDDLDYMHARFHSPLTGRMLSVDPVLAVKRAMKRPQAWNRYAYVAGNPLKYTDPTGKLYKIGGCEAGMVDQCRAGQNLLKGTLGASASMVRFNVDGTVALAKGVSGSSFARQGDFQKGLLKLIGDKSTFTLFAGASSEALAGGGGQSIPLAGGGANIFVDPAMFPKQTGDVQGTAAITLAHETGHALETLFPAHATAVKNSIGISGTGQREGYGMAFENSYRSSLGMGTQDLRYSYLGGAQDILSDDVDLFP